MGFATLKTENRKLKIMSAKQLFEAGDLSAAIATLTQEIKSNPGDAQRRTFFFELLCFAGELDRADKQLDVVAQQDVQSEWGVQVYRNILAAERNRRRLFSDGLKPEFLLDPPDYLHLHLDAINRLRENQPAEALELLERSEDARPVFAGELNGKPFEEFRDCDDVLAPVLELIILRDYIWLPFEQIRELEVSPPERPRDLIWAPARVALSDGTERRGYVPTLYCDSHRSADDLVKLGNETCGGFKLAPME